jgi:tRNA A-37 threonylcarbamoyl transferase component Bud32
MISTVFDPQGLGPWEPPSMTEAQLRERIKAFSRFAPRGSLRVHRNTSEFMEIRPDDVIELEGRFFLVRGEESEGRFGLDGEPKFWVKRVVDLEDGAPRILKLVFHETFIMKLGEQRIRCYRSPRKESRILEKVKGHPHFMQGVTLYDEAGNPVRVIERIRGASFYEFIHGLDLDHRRYFLEVFPEIFEKVLASFEAMATLHRMGEIHGDVRNDHILVERQTGLYRWIDFDYAYEWTEQPFGVDLFGLGNILLFAVGKGFHTIDMLGVGVGGVPAQTAEPLTPDDFSLFFPNRLMNLRKIFPYIPDSLNHVLMYFSSGAEVFYEEAEEMIADLHHCKELCRREVFHGT